MEQHNSSRRILLAEDEEAMRTYLAKALENAGYDVDWQPDDSTIHLGLMDHVVTNRLHIGKMCALYKIPHTLISYDRKTETPEVVGDTGEILRLSGDRIAVSDVSIPEELFQDRRRMSIAFLERMLAK